MSQTKAQLIDTLVASLLPASDSSVDIGSNGVRFANIYGDTLYGDGSNLTGITSTTINNNADNRLITGSGSANTLNGESGLTFDGTTLDLTATSGKITINSTGPALRFIDTNADSDFMAQADGGLFKLVDLTNSDATRLVLNSSGKVGINETNPSEMLHIKAEDNSDSFGGLIIKANNNSVHMKYGWRGLDANSGGDIRFAVGGTELMRVLSSGKVGLGRTSADEMLHILADDNTDGFGGLKIDANNGSINCKYGWLGADGSNSFRIAVAGTEHMRVANDGKVGIGTTSPVAKLQVAGSAHITGQDSVGLTAIQFSYSAPEGHIKVKNTSGGPAANLAFHTTDTSGNTNRVMHLRHDGKVGIGTTAPIGTLDVHDGTLVLSKDASNSSSRNWQFVPDNGAAGNLGLRVSTAAGGSTFSNVVEIKSDGKVGIGLTTPDQLLHVYESSGSSQSYIHVQNNRSRNAAIKFTTTQGSWLVGQGIGNDNNRFAIYDTAERFVLNSSGNVGINTASPAQKLDVNGTIKGARLLINTTAHHNSSRVNILGHTNNTSHTCFRCAKSDDNQLFLVRNDGAVIVNGSFSKGSGSFLIEHPLPSLAATKTLRHSFIEGTQCDNIYRGKVTLSSGTASINLDTVSKMTEGTFVVLNRDVQCFTSNETGWNAVKGSVTGNILTITCENNSSTDTISWMVVGERQDPNIKASTITDDDGYLLIEEDIVAELPY